ncbi:PAS domain S-box protein [bacterium]|nr:PAS domain S-box protein [bacterium]
MDQPGKLLLAHEEWLIARILFYAHRQGYIVAIPPQHDIWKAVIRNISSVIIKLEKSKLCELEIRPDENFQDDTFTRIVLEIAEHHHNQGINLTQFLGLFKYYRQTYQDLITEKYSDLQKPEIARLRINRLFDHFEIELIKNRIELNNTQRMSELELINKVLTTEKNKFQTILHSLPTPILLFDDKGVLHFANHIANQLWKSKNHIDIILPEAIQDTVQGVLDSPKLKLKTENVEVLFEGRYFQYRLEIMPMRNTNDIISSIIMVAHDITQLDNARNALRDSEWRYRSIFENDHTPMLIINPDNSSIIDANPAASNFYGYKIHELKTMKLSDISTSSDLKTFSKMEQVLYKSKKYFQSQHVLKNGEKRFVDIFCGPVHIEGRTLIYSIIHDVTSRFINQKALQDSEARYRLLAENINDVIWTMTPQGKFTYISPSVMRLRGYTPDEVINQTLTEVLTHQSAVIVADSISTLQTAVKNNHIPDDHIRLELEQPKKDGSSVWTEADITPIFNEDNKLEMLLGVSRDISQEKATRDILAQLAAVVNQATVSIVITDLDGNIIYINPHTSKISGYSHSELLGKNPRLLKSDKQDAAFYKSLWDTIANGMTWSNTFINLRKDGTEYHEHAVIFPIKDNEDNIIYYAAVKRDITEQVHAQAELKKAKELAEDANKAKGLFLANMSHEIRTPMNAILGFAEIIENQTTDSSIKAFTTNIQSAGKTLLQLINEILDLSRIESGRLELQPGYCNIKSLINDIANLFSFQMKEKSIRFTLDVQKNVPSALLLDIDRLKQIFLNLIDNAVKFTQAGTIEIRVGIVDLRDSIVDIKIEIQDTGKGIPSSQQNRIFESFMQVEGQDQAKYGGTGLGLSIVKQLVEMMNGTILLRSEPGKGSTYTITLSDVTILDLRESRQSTVTERRDIPEINSFIDEYQWNLSELSKLEIDTFIKNLEGRYYKYWKTLSKSMIIHEIVEFADEINTLSTKFNIQPMAEWSSKLHNLAINFDMEQLPDTIKEYPALVDKVKTLALAIEDKN